jgi:hypothetical protein
MLVKALGAIDFISGLTLIFGINLLPHFALIIFSIILIAKSLMGLPRDFASWIDFTSGAVFLLFLLFAVPPVICVIVGILILQKGIFSFL